MTKNVKRKIGFYFSRSFFYIFLMTKGASRNDFVRCVTYKNCHIGVLRKTGVLKIYSIYFT